MCTSCWWPHTYPFFSCLTVFISTAAAWCLFVLSDVLAGGLLPDSIRTFTIRASDRHRLKKRPHIQDLCPLCPTHQMKPILSAFSRSKWCNLLRFERKNQTWSWQAGRCLYKKCTKVYRKCTLWETENCALSIQSVEGELTRTTFIRRIHWNKAHESFNVFLAAVEG